jgi:hypothetical protein
MHMDRSVDNIEQYKVAKKTVKRTVSEASGQIYDRLYQRLGTKEEGGRTSIGWPKAERGRRWTSSK